MFPRVLYLDQDNSLELDWLGFGALQVRNRYGAVRRAHAHQKQIFLELVRLFQAHGQPVHPSNPRCSRLMAEFVSMLKEPADSLTWRALQADLGDAARVFAEDDSPVNMPDGQTSVSTEAAEDTQRFMIMTSAALGGVPRRMLDDPFVIGAIASHTTNVLHRITNGQCSPALVSDTAILAVQLSFIGSSVTPQEAARVLLEHRNHPEYEKATQVVSLILGARYGRPDSNSQAAVHEVRKRLIAMPKAFRNAFGSTENEQIEALLSQEHFVNPLKERYGELWRDGGGA
jgi:hypothetical protein